MDDIKVQFDYRITCKERTRPPFYGTVHLRPISRARMPSRVR